MKSIVKIIPIFCSLLLTVLFSPITHAQQNTSTETGLDGDHFSLEGALELFKAAKSLEKFEESLNASNNDVNNLDLDEDGQVDYIRIEDHQEGEVHAIVLQVAVSKSEVQDVAVIEIEKTGKETAILQILGDENLYGEQTIVEPYEVSTQSDPAGRGGPSADIMTTRIVVNVWGWSPVRFIYRPTYRVYVSPYRWRTYPRYYKPWAPRPWRTFRTAVVYRPHFRVVTTHRVVRAHKVYTPRRKSSVVVHKRTTTRVAARPNGKKVTTTKKVTGPKGNTVTKRTTTAGAKTKKGKVGARKTTTVKKGKKGNTVKRKTTTTKVKRKR